MDETTDVDRLDATFEELPEHGIAAVQFADWASLGSVDSAIMVPLLWRPHIEPLEG